MSLKLVLGSTFALCTLGFANLAVAADDVAAEPPAAEPPAADPPAADPAAAKAEASAKAKQPPPAPEAADEDGVRFRGGISGGAGAEVVLDCCTAGMGGVDGRLGVQVMDLLGIYAQLHGSFGSFGEIAGSALFGLTGTAAATVLADFTFIDQIFVGAGAGYGVLNNPHGPVVHLRAGGYPYMDFGEDGVRRKGLMLGVDVRVFITTGDLIAVYPMAQIGYEAF
jgi:hypothetical protein